MPSSVGIIYFYIHLITEVLCFYFLSLVVGDSFVLWLIPFLYDILAFVPQLLFGYISDQNPRIPFGLIGIVSMVLGLTLFSLTEISVFIPLIFITLGNACVHIDGAETTLRSSHGRIAPAAIFVAGGSFGVALGKLLSGLAPFWFIIFLALSAIPFIIFGSRIRKSTERTPSSCKAFSFANTSTPLPLFILLVALVVVIRGFVGYGIPTSWNKSTLEMLIFYFSMGIGKGLGGILVDRIGIRKTAFLSTIVAIPFLLFGDHIMYVSIVGIALFSMTMAITLALLVSRMPRYPGVAFGITTTALTLGTLPIFFFRPEGFLVNALIITISSIICLLILIKTERTPRHA